MSLSILAFIAAIVSGALGFVWFGPLFGKQWVALVGMPTDAESKKKGMKRMPLYMFLNFVANFLLASVLFMLLKLLGAYSFGTAFPIALVLFIGFILSSEITSVLWNGKKPREQFRMWALSIGFQVAMFLVWLLMYGWLA